MSHGTSIHAQAQSPAHIRRDEPGLSPDVHHADVVGVPVVPEGGRLEGGQSVCLPSERRQTPLVVPRYVTYHVKLDRLLRASESICGLIVRAPTQRRQ